MVADAQEREIVCHQPFEELDRFRRFVRRQRRRIFPQFLDHPADAVEYRAPVGHRNAHIGKHHFEFLHDDGPPQLVFDAFDMDMDEAFAQRRAVRPRSFRQRRQRAGRVALRRQHRMHDKPDRQAAFRQRRHDRIDQERHVVIDDLDHRDAVQPGGAGGRLRIGKADFRMAGFADLQKLPALLAERGELFRLIAEQVFRGGA